MARRPVTVDRIEQGDPLFDSLYTLVRKWDVPNGESVRLFHRGGPGRCCQQHDALTDWNSLAGAIREAWSNQATLVYPNEDLAVLVGALTGSWDSGTP